MGKHFSFQVKDCSVESETKTAVESGSIGEAEWELEVVHSPT